MKDFSVIIVTYKSYTLLSDSLRSIYKFNDIGDRLEVIVVDNAPSANEIDQIKSNFPTVVYIENENNGFGGGNNVGALHAHGKYLLFLNPDTFLVEPIFKTAIDIFEKDSKLGMFGVRLITAEGKTNQSFNFHHWLGLWKSCAMRICSFLHLFFPKFMYTCGADIFVPKRVFDECGRFDEKIFMYGEETDLTLRINSLGYKNRYFKKKKIVHLEGGATTSGENNKYMKMLRSYQYLSEKFSFSMQKEVRKEIRKTKVKMVVLRLGLRKTDDLTARLAFLLSLERPQSGEYT